MTKPTFQEAAAAIFGGLLILVTVNLISEVGRTARWALSSPEERKMLILRDLTWSEIRVLRWDSLTETERLVELTRGMEASQLKILQDVRSLTPVSPVTSSAKVEATAKEPPPEWIKMVVIAILVLCTVICFVGIIYPFW